MSDSYCVRFKSGWVRALCVNCGYHIDEHVTSTAWPLRKKLKRWLTWADYEQVVGNKRLEWWRVVARWFLR